MRCGLILLLSMFYTLATPLFGQAQANAELPARASTEMAEEIYEKATKIGKLWQVIPPTVTQGEVKSSHWGDFVANIVWLNVLFARVGNLPVNEPATFETFCKEEEHNIKRRGEILSYFTKEETRMLFNLKTFATNKKVAQGVIDYLSKQNKLDEFNARLLKIRNAYTKETEIVHKILRGPI